MFLATLIASAIVTADDGEAYSKVVNSVVWVVAIDRNGYYHHGTGVVVPEGILTAHHIVKDRRVSVVFPARDAAGQVIAETSFYSPRTHHVPGLVVHADPVRDLALLKVAPDTRAKAATLSIKSASPGEHVFSLGGDGKAAWRHACGNVRQVRTRPVRFVETSLPLNDGDSGGALFNARGEVVAINSSSSRELSLVNQSVNVAEIREFLKAAHETPQASRRKAVAR